MHSYCLCLLCGIGLFFKLLLVVHLEERVIDDHIKQNQCDIQQHCLSIRCSEHCLEGSGQVEAKNLPMTPSFIIKYVIRPFTGIARTNGINIVGFSIIGIPKIIGSLMLKMEGTMPSLPTVLRCFDFAKATQQIARARVAPDPPIVKNAHQNRS